MISKNAGLYIHVPFCRTKCPYCDFYSLAHVSRIQEFLDALFMEIKLCAIGNTFPPFDTLYFGGGTPSLLSADTISDLIHALRLTFTFSNYGSEITLEANPADLSSDYLSEIKKAGINRLTIGIQSFHTGILKFLGRRHNGEEAIQAFHNARSAGFENIGIDCMYGIPGQSLAEWTEDLQTAISLRPEHISCYQLTISEKTPFGIRCRKGTLTELDEEAQYAFFEKTLHILHDAGYEHYEISNFARTASLRSKHNQKYWDHSPYLGLGPSAHSFLPESPEGRPKRWWNQYSISDYITDLTQQRLPIAGSEYLNHSELGLESLYLGLRTSSGVNLESYFKEYGRDLRRHPEGVVDMLIRENHATIEDNILRLTLKGQALCDTIVGSLTTP
ncbi:MAG: radical SAM family heme chaperone HemW [bacterium]